MAERKLEERRQFAEEFGILFEKAGLPPMAGRIWGFLLVANPAHQSAAQITEAVGCSRSSVSTMTDMLMQMGMVKRVAVPGERMKFYQVAPDGFTDALRRRMWFTRKIREMAERGLTIVEDEPVEVRRALEEYRDCARFFECEFPALIERWEERRNKG